MIVRSSLVSMACAAVRLGTAPADAVRVHAGADTAGFNLLGPVAQLVPARLADRNRHAHQLCTTAQSRQKGSTVNTDEIVCPEAFRPDDPTIQIDPYPYYSVLRDQKPVLASTFGEQPCWIVSRRKDVAQILMDPATFSSNTTPIPSMLHTDPPDHRRLRRMVAAMFTRKAVAPYGPAFHRSQRNCSMPRWKEAAATLLMISLDRLRWRQSRSF